MRSGFPLGHLSQKKSVLWVWWLAGRVLILSFLVCSLKDPTCDPLVPAQPKRKCPFSNQPRTVCDSLTTFGIFLAPLASNFESLKIDPTPQGAWVHTTTQQTKGGGDHPIRGSGAWGAWGAWAQCGVCGGERWRQFQDHLGADQHSTPPLARKTCIVQRKRSKSWRNFSSRCYPGLPC